MTEKHNNKNDTDTSTYDNQQHLDFADFGDPTPETLLAFIDSLEVLKAYAAEHAHKEVIPLDDDANPNAPKIVGHLTQYQIADQGNLHAVIYDASPEVMAQVGSELKDAGMSLVDIRLTDGDKTIEYSQQYGEEATLYVASRADRVERESSDSSDIESSMGMVSVGLTGTPELMRWMHTRIEERAEARRLGLDKPTEGTMKLLVAGIKSELAKPHDTVEDK